MNEKIIIIKLFKEFFFQLKESQNLKELKEKIKPYKVNNGGTELYAKTASLSACSRVRAVDRCGIGNFPNGYDSGRGDPHVTSSLPKSVVIEGIITGCKYDGTLDIDDRIRKECFANIA